jgi:hypothetical protein
LQAAVLLHDTGNDGPYTAENKNESAFFTVNIMKEGTSN